LLVKRFFFLLNAAFVMAILDLKIEAYVRKIDASPTEAQKVYSKDVLVLVSRVSIRVTQPEHTTVDGSPATWHRRCWAHQVNCPSLCVQSLFANDFKT
jgi:hypothetical protein